MELEGIVQNGVIIPQGECTLPEGTRVRIQAEPTPSGETVGQRLNKLAEKFGHELHDLPADYSLNFEHYLYGVPKKS